MTTEETRDLNVLLNLGTYQGMTDAEIESVIAFKVKQEVTSADNIARMNAMELEAQMRLEQAKEAADRDHDMIESIMNRQLVFRRVEGNNG